MTAIIDRDVLASLIRTGQRMQNLTPESAEYVRRWNRFNWCDVGQCSSCRSVVCQCEHHAKKGKKK